MASTTAVQSRAANIVVPSIHLGSFSTYSGMQADVKQSIRFPEDNPGFRDDKPASYSQQRNPPVQYRPTNVSYPPAQSYTYKAFPPSRASYIPVSVSPRTIPGPTSLYPSGVSSQSPSLPVQPPNSPAQMAGPPREVCVECMMRDEDMADVDVTSPGVWDRESDVWYHELCQREEEEEREREQNPHPTSSSGISSSASCSRPRARGGKLTEGNVKVWLTLNPREPAAKQQTLHAYLDAQNALLVVENKARIQNIKESRQLDDKMRDAYSELRRSAYDLGAKASAVDDGGVKIRSSGTNGFADGTQYPHKRDTTLLENGMIVERIDVRKEESRMRKEERRARKASRDSLSAMDNKDRDRDAMSLYSYQAAEGSASLRAPAPYDSTMSVTLPARSVRSMYTTPSTSWQPTPLNRPMSMAPGSIPGFASQTSLDSSASPRRRFFGRQWSEYFGSSTSLAQSGSMVDMHIGLDQDRHFAQTPHVDIGSNAPSLREAWPRVDDTQPRSSFDAPSPTNAVKKKKMRGLGKLWKIITGAPKTNSASSTTRHAPYPEEDEPLAPPPPLSYLVNRSSIQTDRSMSMMGPGRHASMPSLSQPTGAHHPRSNSTPSNVGVSLSSPSDQSSILPSPTEVRFPYRDSSGTEPEEGGYDDDGDAMSKRKGGLSPRPVIVNAPEPDFLSSSPVPVTISSSPPSRGGGPSSSSLVPTVKVPPPRPMSVLSLDKSLPPLPPGEHEPPAASLSLQRPRSFAIPTSATVPMASYPQHPDAGLSTPNPRFRSEDMARRQSFGGLASQPALPKGAARGIPYDDFGVSRHSLAVIALEPVAAPRKRKKSFGLASLFGRKSNEQHRESSAVSLSRESQPESTNFSGAPPSLSERSSPQGRMSTSSRRALHELVPREPDFVAYRYPSKDERLDLSRG